ncbi:unnamed protein product [Phaedon cochleariae]|uniref:CRIB domain-containing protein n=1 Tax=Phaedon cochleariae TaxID=80249 RepID=A0A9P0D9C1_PHACE|nr:unnamed protein product [Phaedon cochleariae]
MAAISELRVSLFSCCIPRPQKRRHLIDRSMIGNPTNFQHTGHIGSRDVELPGDQLAALQNQMKSKGGYEASYKEPDWCQ